MDNKDDEIIFAEKELWSLNINWFNFWESKQRVVTKETMSLEDFNWNYYKNIFK